MTKYERRKLLAGVPACGVESYLKHQHEKEEARKVEIMENVIIINGKMYDKRYYKG